MRPASQSTLHWIGQYLLAAGTMFLLLCAIDLAWSLAAAAIFVAARWRSASQAVTDKTR